MSKGIFLSRDIVAIGDMRASKFHCSAILPKNIAPVNQPLKLNKIAHFVQRVICSVHSASVYSGKVKKTMFLQITLSILKLQKWQTPFWKALEKCNLLIML